VLTLPGQEIHLFDAFNFNQAWLFVGMATAKLPANAGQSPGILAATVSSGGYKGYGLKVLEERAAASYPATNTNASEQFGSIPCSDLPHLNTAP
jgi:hypothetical protein